MSIAIVILAAGASTRLGAPKQLLPYDGTTLLRHTVDSALASDAAPVIVVLGAYAEQIRPELNDMPVHTVVNTRWSEGMGSSLRAGMAALEQCAPHAEAVIFTVCDQPFLSAETINRLVNRYGETGSAIVASAYAGTLGVPTLFDRTLFQVLAQADGSDGAKNIIRRYRYLACAVSFPQGEVDIDTVQDSAMLALGQRRMRADIGMHRTDKH